jgi:hypothetical protein
MKTFVVAFFVVLSLSSFASSGSKTPLSAWIKQEIKRANIQVSGHENAIVLVSFKVDENGQVQIQDSNTNNDVLCAQVLQILNKVVLPVTSTFDEVYQMKFVFRRL